MNRMYLLKKGLFLWLWFLILPWSLPLRSQDAEADSVKAFRLHFKGLPPANKLDAEVPDFMRDYFLILAPPKAIVIRGNPAPENRFILLDRNKGKSFKCTDDTGRISFIPIQFRLKDIPVTYTPWKTDTIRGFPVFKTYRVVNAQTLISWNTKDFGMNHNEYEHMDGVPLYMEEFYGEDIYRMVLHKADTIRIPKKYLDPNLSNAPINFNSPMEAFSTSSYLFTYGADLQNYKLPNFQGKIFPGKGKISMKKQQGNILAFILVDYSLTGGLSDYYKDWLLRQNESSEVKAFILTRSTRSVLKKTMEKDPSLKQIPHLQISDAMFFRLGGTGPMYLLVIDQGGVICFNENAFFLFDTTKPDQCIQALRVQWKD